MFIRKFTSHTLKTDRLMLSHRGITSVKHIVFGLTKIYAQRDRFKRISRSQLDCTKSVKSRRFTKERGYKIYEELVWQRIIIYLLKRGVVRMNTSKVSSLITALSSYNTMVYLIAWESGLATLLVCSIQCF